MNERIKLLAEEAGIAIWGDAAYMYHPKDTLDSDTLKKFAELIVKECCHIMNTTAKKAEESNTYMGDDVPTRVHQYTIKQHFGVEE